MVILIAGFPGCGKTTYLCELFCGGWLAFDDFKSEAIDNCSAFYKSRKFPAPILALRYGVKCVVADIDFCKTESREQAESALQAEVPGVEIDWRYFSHDVQACEANIKRRHRHSLVEDLNKLTECASYYCIPPGVVVRPCYRIP